MAATVSRPDLKTSRRRAAFLVAIAALSMLAIVSARPTAASGGGFSLGRAHGGGGVGFGYATSVGSSASDRAAFQYAIIQKNSNTTCSVNGDDDLHAIRDLQLEVQRTGREAMWFAIDGRQYVVRDPAVLERAREIVAPMNRLGVEQGKLGGMQGELGRRQGELGALQGRIGGLEGRVAALEVMDDPRHRNEIAELRQQVAELSAMARRMDVRQRTLGEQQAELGRQQSELGEQQARASAIAQEQLRSLADRAVASGTAEPAGGDR